MGAQYVEKLKRMMIQIALTPNESTSSLSVSQKFFIPILSVASSMYQVSVLVRQRLYTIGLFSQRRLPLPVISVGNLTWGGNGKTPMVEFIAHHLVEDGICPLIITRHLRLARNLDILMINGMMPWGNGRLIPCGPLREPLTALRRVHIAVIHNANMVPDMQLEMIVSQLREIKKSLPTFFSRLDPSHFFNVQQPSLTLSLTTVQNVVVLCISSLGFAEAFVQTIEKLEASYVDRMDFTDHHSFTDTDIHLINERIKQLECQFAAKPLVVVTEKDYDRDYLVLTKINQANVLVLCSSLNIIEQHGRSQDSFMKLLRSFIDC